MADENAHQVSTKDLSDSHKVYPDRSVLGGEIGLWSSNLNALPAPRAREAASEIEELGYAALWFGEALGREAFTNASMLLSATSHLVVATGIANIFVRDAWATNAAAKTLAGAHPGRFVLGLGVSHKPMVEMRGHDYRSPLSTMRRLPKRHARSAVHGRAAGARSAVPPRCPRAQDAGALQGSRRRRAPLPGDPAAHGGGTREPRRRSPARGGAGSGPDRRAREGFEAGTLPPEPLHAGGELSEQLAPPGLHRRRPLGEGSLRLVEGLVAWGSEDDIRGRVREHLSAGADQVCVQVVIDRPAEGLRDMWRSLAPVLLG